MHYLVAHEVFRGNQFDAAHLALALFAAALLVFPTQSVDAAREGLRLCSSVIVPSLFPFFVLSGFCVELGLTHYLGRALEPLMRPLFRVGGACASAFVLGIMEMFTRAQAIAASQVSLVPYAIAAGIYWVCCLVIEFVLHRLDK